jgi:hypothetical protein
MVMNKESIRFLIPGRYKKTTPDLSRRGGNCMRNLHPTIKTNPVGMCRMIAERTIVKMRWLYDAFITGKLS